MEQARFDARAVQVRGYAAELQETAQDCAEQANHLVAGLDPAEWAPSREDSRTSYVLDRISVKIERVMAAYDRLQKAVGRKPRYGPALDQLRARPAARASSRAPSD